MKALLTLIVVLAVLNALARGGMAVSAYFELKDSTENLLVRESRATPESIQGAIMTLAGEDGIQLAPEDVVVAREAPRTTAHVAYVQPVEFFPGWSYAVPFSFEVNALDTFYAPPTPDQNP